MRKTIAAIGFFSLLSGCATMTEQPPASSPEPLRPPAGNCDASAVQSYVGEMANQQSGIAIRSASGARALRWGPPDSAWTMDYRDDRVNVRYDTNMVITAITCG
ncbi:hypothetical protein NAP1_10363 [Erythrobacter sp. NAP1]|uniref:I78 family peptidase inhibitor n=1 Tax=Erythrobacter sp. NAP1 TaxID=237727 RepID=UPI0000687831|nr:I78 family peptidase inhibitor [Erythrobacter sp. NAP1]EAQ27990.1 hypothetical protein NAP1_10363 [Erythrobacter sp. NAP1]